MRDRLPAHPPPPKKLLTFFFFEYSVNMFVVGIKWDCLWGRPVRSVRAQSVKSNNCYCGLIIMRGSFLAVEVTNGQEKLQSWLT